MFRITLLLLLAQAEAQPIPLEQMYEQAVALMEAEAWDNAIEKLEAIREEEPGHVPTLFNLAICLSETDRVDCALDVYRQVLELDSTLFEARMNLAILLHESGDSEAAVEEFARAAALAPDDLVPVLYRAQALDQSGRNREAEQEYRKVLAIEAEVADAWEKLGFLYRRTQRNEEAYEALIQAERLGARSPALSVNLGDLAIEAEDLIAARGHFKNANRLVPEDQDVQLRLALTLRDLEEFPEAIALLETLPDATAALAEAYFASEAYDRALAVYESLVEADPDNADYWYLVGRSFFEMDRREEAIPYLQKSLVLDPERVAGWGTLAAIHYSQEDWVNAGAMLLKYLEIEPDHAPSHFGVATCFDNLGNFQKALLHYNRFIELDDGSNDVRSFQVRQRAKVLRARLQKN